MHICAYIFVCVCCCVYIHTHLYTHKYGERERTAVVSGRGYVNLGLVAENHKKFLPS